MIKFENTQVSGFEPAIRGMRNPMNSWEKSDTEYRSGDPFLECEMGYRGKRAKLDIPLIGYADHDLMERLNAGGSEHAKYRRMIIVYVDITAPLYWWKEMDTYKVGTVANSCSTMHKIAAKEFTPDDFSCEQLFDRYTTEEQIRLSSHFITIAESRAEQFASAMEDVIFYLNSARERYLQTGNKRYWWQMIQLLPTSYNQKRTLMLNYEVLSSIYRQRKGHKLDEWHAFREWIESLPYSELITGKQEKTE